MKQHVKAQIKQLLDAMCSTGTSETFKQRSTKVPDDLAHQGRRRMEAWEVEMVSV